MTENTNVHHQTKKAADMSLAKKEISPDSHRAIMEGRIGLDEARELGREGLPYGPTPKADKDDRSRECMCGCGHTTRGRFAQGHDQRLVTFAKQYVRGERDLTHEQMAYLEESGKLERAKAQVEKEREKAARKAAKQK